MKKLILLVCLFLPMTVNGIIITEVQVSGDSASNCYIKIFNSTDQDILLDGYKIRKKSATGKDYSIRAIPKGTLIKSQEYILWANSRDGFSEKIKADIYSTATISKNNSIAIISPTGDIVDALSWGSGEDQYVLGDSFASNPDKNQIIKRYYIDGAYQNTKNNSKDFYLYPEAEKEIKINTSTTNNIADPPKSPTETKITISLLSAFLILILKKSIY